MRVKVKRLNVVDGDASILLQALRNHTSLSLDRLKSLVIKHLATDESFEPVLEYVDQNGWVKCSNNDLLLSQLGEEWLDEQAAGLTVEDEDSSSDDQPQKPYDVAKLKMEPKNFSVFQVLRKIEKHEINLSPDFQRAFVWDDVRQSRLIESILIRIPLPAFYLDATDQVRWSVVDGLQRLYTLNRYCRGESFPLKGLQFLTELIDHRFEDLPQLYKVLIEDDTQLQFYNLMPGTPAEAKFTIFSRVNTGGMQLTPQEIRHALSQGKATDLLGRLAKHEVFRTVTDGAVESLRMSDRELVLRSLAFMHVGVNTYREFNELDKFLLHAMADLNNQPDEVLEELENTFIDSLKKVSSIFGRYAFRKFSERGGRRSPLNKALFEVWTVCVRQYEIDVLKANQDEIVDGFIVLLQPWQGFARSISSSTGSSSAVSTRFSEIRRLLRDVCR